MFDLRLSHPARRFSLGRIAAVGLLFAFSVAVVGAPAVSVSAAATKQQVKGTRKQTSTKGGYIQFIIREQTVTSKGKIKYVPRGNVPVTITTTDAQARCRDAGRFYVRQGDIVFAGKSDADRDHKTNLGKIKADKCTKGIYTLTIAPNPYVYDVVGSASKSVNLATSGVKVKFTVIKKGTPATPDQAGKQDSQPILGTPPVTPLSAITPQEEKNAIDRTNTFEFDVLPSFKLANINDDLGRDLAARKKNFAENHTKYATAAFKRYIDTTYGGDPFPVLGISSLRVGQYNQFSTAETKPIVTSSTGNTAVIEHTITIQPRTPPSTGYTQATQVVRVWSYHVVKSADNWLIDSIDVR